VFSRIMPLLRVAGLQRSIDWYTPWVLSCWRAPNDGGGENGMVRADVTSLMRSTGSHLGGKPSFTGTVF
jgi:hypothetical protein